MKPREPHHKITRGIMNRVLAYAADARDTGFTQKDAAYHTGVFHLDDVIKLLERDGHRFTRVDEGDPRNYVVRYYLVQR